MVNKKLKDFPNEGVYIFFFFFDDNEHNNKEICMETIKNALFQQLSQCNTMPFLFVGSGISRRYINTESWEDLLSLFAGYANSGNSYAYQLYKEPYRHNDNPLSFLPQIASDIERDFNKVWYTDPQWEESRQKNNSLITEHISPFKIAIADHFLNKTLNFDALDPALKSEIELLKSMNAKSVFGIITTNYDRLMELLFTGFDIYIGQEELLFSNPQNLKEIYKIHGCCNKPSSIIINNHDYNAFEKKNAYLAAKLLTIFVEHPIIFLGYSINDSNIESILKAIIDCLSPENLSILKDRLIFIEYDETKIIPSITTFQKNFDVNKSISMTKISSKSYEPIFEVIANNKAKYPTNILRRLKDDVYNLVRTNDAQSNLYVKDIDNIQPNDQIEVVMGVGLFEQMGVSGYKLPSLNQVYCDIVFNDGNFNNNYMVEHTLSSLLVQHSNSVPIYKYLSTYTGQIPEAISRCTFTEFDEFISKTSQKYRGVHKEYYTVKDVIENVPFPGQLEQLAWLLADEIDTSDLTDYLKKLLQEKPDIFSSKHNTSTRRLIKILDWLMYAYKKETCPVTLLS